MSLAGVVDAGAKLLDVLDDGGSGHVGLMLGIDSHVGHGGNDGSEDDVPVLGRVLVEGDLDALEDVDLVRESVKGSLETQSGLATHVSVALQFKHDNVLYHYF